MWQRALVAILALPIAAFAFWGAWEIARQMPTAPQAALGAIAFGAIGIIGLAAGLLGAQAAAR
jgi:hypothetical protein